MAYFMLRGLGLYFCLLGLFAPAQIGVPLDEILPGDSTTGSQNIEAAAIAGGHLFPWDDGRHGSELWFTDGTPSGTVLLADLFPGHRGSTPSHLTLFQGHVYFLAEVPGYGREVWRSDGTAAGTEPFFEFRAGPASAEYGQLLTSHVYLFFMVGGEIWRSSGVPGDAIQLSAGPAQGLGLLNDLALFLVGDAPYLQLWRSDGTEQGTSRLAYGTYRFLGQANQQAIFMREPQKELWKTDGTANGTVLIKNLDPNTRSDGSGDGGSMAAGLTLGDRVLFAVDTRAYGFDVWSSDGSETGTVPLDLAAGSASSVQTTFSAVPLGEQLLIPSINDELFITDGTPDGTEIVLSDFGTSSPTQLTPLGESGGRAWFSEGANHELWVSDGTAAGTVDLESNQLQGGFVSAGQFLFAAQDQPEGLYSNSGTAASTALFAELTHTALGSDIGLPSLSLGGGALFGANDSGFSALYFSRGFAGDETFQIYRDQSLILPTAVGDGAYFFGGFQGHKLFRIEGESARQISDTTYWVDGAFVFDGGFYFWFFRDVWRVEGDSISLFSFFYLGADGWIRQTPVVLGDWIYFVTSKDNTSNEIKVWKSKGSQYETQLLGTFQSTVPGPEGELAAVGTKVYFAAPDDMHGVELWCLETTTDTISGPLLDIRTGSESSFPEDFQVMGNTLFFSADDGVHGRELWKSDGTAGGTVLVKDIRPGVEPGLSAVEDGGMEGLVHAGLLLFAANDGTSGLEPWVSDGSEVGTTQLGDLFPGRRSSGPFHFTAFDGSVYFSAADEAHGYEWWRTNGTPGGTSLFLDLLPGVGSGSPGTPAALHNGIFFFGEGEEGREGYLLRPLPDASFTVSAANFCENSTGHSATAPEIIDGASYTWSVTNGSISAGQGTRSVVFDSATGADVTIDLDITASARTGSSQQVLAMSSAEPGAPANLDGPNDVCPHEQGLVYSVDDDPAAVTFEWEAPAGATITSGQGTSSIILSLGFEGGELRVRGVNACGGGDWASLMLNLTEFVPAFAGTDQTLCGTSTTLQANLPTGGSGSWTILDGEGGSFSDANAADSTFTGIVDETYLLKWSLSHGACGDTEDTVVIHFTPSPSIANAGDDQTVCGVSVVLNANDAGNGYGVWSVVSGVGGSFDDVFDPTTNFHGQPGEAYELRWSIFQKPCPADTDEVLVNLGNQGVHDAGSGGCFAINLPLVLDASGEGTWSVLSGPDTSISQFADVNDPNTAFTPAGGPGTYELQWLFQDDCGTLSDTVSLVMQGAILTPRLVSENGAPETSISSNPTRGVGLGAHLFFAADHANYGLELFQTDGESVGLVFDLNNGPADGFSSFFATLGDTLLFLGDDGLVSGLFAVEYGGVPRLLLAGSLSAFDSPVPYNGKLLFEQGGLYETDGTAAGTFRAPLGDEPLGSYEGLLVFRDNTTIYMGNPDGSNTWNLTPGLLISSPSSTYPVSGGFVFHAELNGQPTLFFSDGTTAGTVQISDFDGTILTEPAVLGGVWFFVVDTVENGAQIWRCDGTATGTSRITNFSSHVATDFAPLVFDGRIFFVARNPTPQLWRGDGSAGGFEVVFDGYVQDLALFGDQLLLSANGLWTSDGTAKGTSFLFEVPGLGHFVGSVGEHQVFAAGAAGSPDQGNEPWVTDGTGKGTRQLANLGSNLSQSSLGAVLGNTLIYTSVTDEGQWQLRANEGSAASDRLIDVIPSRPVKLVVSGNHLFFTLDEDLWVSDGVNPSVQLSTSIWRDMMLAYDDGLFFVNFVNGLGFEPHFTDGTLAGTRLISDLRSGSSYRVIYKPFIWKNLIWFSYHYKLWFSDTTAAGTQAAPPAGYGISFEPDEDIYPGENIAFYFSDNGNIITIDDSLATSYTGSNIDHVAVATRGDEMFFLSNAGSGRRILYFNNGSSTRKLAEFEHAIDAITVLDGKAWFTADAGLGLELYSSDGTADGLTVYDLSPIGPSTPGLPFEHRGTIYFEAQGDASGKELWALEQDCPRRIGETLPGADYAAVTHYLSSEDQLFMLASGPNALARIWVIGTPITLADGAFGERVLELFDSNGDGLIEQLEAAAVTSLDLTDAGVRDLGDVLLFPNLERLFADANPITDLSVLLQHPNLLGGPGHQLSVENGLLSEDDCEVIAALQDRADLSGASFDYANQGDILYTPSLDSWPGSSVLVLIGGLLAEPYILDCGLERRSRRPNPPSREATTFSRKSGSEVQR